MKKKCRNNVHLQHFCYHLSKPFVYFMASVFSISLLISSVLPFVVFQPISGQIVDSSIINVDKPKELSARDIQDSRYSDLVNFTSKIQQIYGHLNASLLNKQAGNESLAFAHASHPIAEVYPLVERQVANTNNSLNQLLYSTLVNLPKVSTDSAYDQYLSTVESTDDLLKDITRAVLPEDLQNDVVFNSFVIINLLDLAGYEYQIAVTNGTITTIFEYQDSRAFIKQAEKLMSILMAAPHTSANSSGLMPLVNSLNNSIEAVSTPEEVYLTIDAIFSKLESILGIDKLTLLSKLGVTTD